jgi:hypothetical protein
MFKKFPPLKEIMSIYALLSVLGSNGVSPKTN